MTKEAQRRRRLEVEVCLDKLLNINLGEHLEREYISELQTIGIRDYEYFDRIDLKTHLLRRVIDIRYKYANKLSEIEKVLIGFYDEKS